MNMQVIQALSDGVLMGGVYALAALGLSLIFGVMRITNFAHGAMMTVGMYGVYYIATSFGISPYLALVMTIFVMFLMGYLIQKYVIHYIEHASAHNQLLLTLGVAYVLENLLLAFFSPNYQTLTVEAFQKAVRIGELTFNPAKLIALGIVVLVTAVICVLLYKTRIGRHIRAAAQSSEGAMLIGINVRMIRAVTFGIGAVCTGIAGGLLTPVLSIYPTIGETFQLKCFVIAVLGGMGSMWGALISGVIIGVIESVTGYFLGGSWGELMIYGVFILILLVCPNGLFGRRNRRES